MNNLFQGTSDNFQDLVDTQDKVIIVDFYAEWCGPCRSLSPILDKVAEKYEDIMVVKVDVDNSGVLVNGNPYNVKGIPQMFFIKNGEVKSRLSGLQSMEAISSIIEPLID